MTKEEIFEKNLGYIREIHPDLVSSLRDAPSLYDELIPCKSGAYTLKVAGEDGKLKYLHSRQSPVERAEQLKQKFDFGVLEIYILFGHGLGYECELFFENMKPNSGIICFEPSVSVFRTWMELGDHEQILTNHNVRFMVGIAPKDIYYDLRAVVSRMFASQPLLIPIPESDRIYPSYFKAVREELQEMLRIGSFMLQTSFTLARANLKNRMGNLPYYVATQPVDMYKDRFKGKPGICVLAGPSLEKNIDLLQDFKGKIPLISVSTTLKLMLNRGIIPDFSVVLDFQKLSQNFFSNIDPDLNIPLLCDPKGNSAAIDAYTGPKVFYDDPWTNNLFEDEPRFQRGTVQSGGTVAHLAFGFAKFMGCDPIILVGQDLAFSDGLTHIPGTAYFNWWGAEVNRFNHYEGIEWKTVRKEMDGLKPLEDWQGNRIYSTVHFISYARELETMFKDTDSLIIDATEGGQVFKHTEVTSLQKVKEKYLGSLDPMALELPLLPTTEQRDNLLYIKEQLQKRLKESGHVGQNMGLALTKLTTIRNRLRQDKNIRHLVAEATELNKVLSDYKHLAGAVADIMSSDEFYKNISDAKIEAEGLDGKERVEAQLQRDRNYVDALQAANKTFAKEITKTIKIIDNMLEALA